MKKLLEKLIDGAQRRANNDNFALFWRFLVGLLEAVMKELNSIAGKINIITDLLLLVMFVCILISTSFNTLFTAIQNIFAMYLSYEINSLDFNALIICFIIFAFVSLCCLVFMAFIIKNEKKLDNIIINDDKDE